MATVSPCATLVRPAAGRTDRGESVSGWNQLRERRVEVVRDLERAGAEAERTRAGKGGGDGAKLSDRATAANHEEVFPGLHPVQQGVRVPLELLQADLAHGGMLADRGRRRSGLRRQPSDYTCRT